MLRETPGLCRPTSVTPGICHKFPGQNSGVSGRTGIHRSAAGATPGMHCRKL